MSFLCLLVPHDLSETITKDLVHKRELEVNTSREAQLPLGPVRYKLSCLTTPAPQTTAVGDTNYIRRTLVFYKGGEKRQEQ